MTKPITRAEYNKLARQLRDVMKLASTHDPEHEQRLDVVERRLDRIGAPKYRRA
jgi:hypothetical protein